MMMESFDTTHYGASDRRPETNGSAEQLATALGWFSIGLGLAEIAAPSRLARLIGVPDEDRTYGVLRAYGMREIAAADRRFDALTFLEGARSAYGMILDAFWRGDKEELGQLCDRDVYEGFASAIDARIAAGETLDNRLVRVEEAAITSASYNAPMARITVRFESEQISVTLDENGRVLDGDPAAVVAVVDVFAFARDVDSPDPNWRVVATASPE